MLIPAGTQVQIAEGTSLEITHKLGGNYTVKGAFGMARISGADFDALGETSAPETSAMEETISKTDFTPPDENELWNIAKTVFDPEIPLNIVDLGLVYRIDLIKTPDGKYAVETDMTLTTPGCVMGPYIADDLKGRFKAIPGIDDAMVNIVWDPPWSKDMISEEGKMTLGLI